MFNPIKYEGNLGEQYSYLIKDLYELCNNEENTIANLSNASALLNFFLEKMSAGMARILFILYSLVIGTIFSTVGFAYSPLAILYAFASALTIFVVMSIYGFFTKEDLSSYRTFLIVGLISLIVMGLFNIYLGVGVLYWIETIVGIVIFTGFTAYDVNRIKHISYQLANEEGENVEKLGIKWALELYLDFINLFLYALRIFGRRK